MCGIAGWIGHIEDPTRVAAGLRAALRHRGPDRQDHRQWSRAGLVHTRLSIIDLSDAGSQPMCNEDGTVWVAFNGEIYNHADERRHLEARGHRFRGRSDTEVLPHLYQEFGRAFVTRLKGMFAWAIYEPAHETLLLGRDRFGIKPLFYAASEDRLVFASEINALKTVVGVDLTPDPQALSDYLALFCIPAPLTFYRGIRALPPGHVLEARWLNGRVQTDVRPFHEWTIAPRSDLTLDEAVDEVDRLIQSSVGRQLQSDVPLGALLSGGIDSSLVSAAAQAATGRLHTYNVRFPDAGHDETDAARAVSAHIHSHHETLDLQELRGTWDVVTGLLAHAGQPFADTSMFAVNAISRVMRRRVTTALSGDGGDEGFGGYPLYAQLDVVAAIQALPRGLVRFGATLLVPPARAGALPAQMPSRLRLLADADAVGVVQAFRSWVRVDEQNRLSRLRGVEPVRRWFESRWQHDLPRRASTLERLSALATEVDARVLLPSDMLFKVDLASMKEGLEIRVPLLDEDLFAFGLRLPHALKSRKRVAKRVLRGVAARRLPSTVATKKKHGFTVPVDVWVTADFKTQLQRVLLHERTSLPDVIDPAVYRPWIMAFCQNRRLQGITREGLYQRAAMLLALHLALES